MFDSFEASSDISSSSSFDFTELLDDDEPQLLSRSLSLEALPAISDDYLPPFHDVPPFPLEGRVFPITPILLDDYPPLTPKHGTGLDPQKPMKTILTIPTSPRMAKMLEEPLVVDKWAVCYTTATVPIGN